MSSKLLSQKQVAEIIGVHPNTIKNWRQAKLFSFFRAPGSRRPFYFKDEVDEFILKNTTSIKKVGKPATIKKIETIPLKTGSDDWRI